jgi:hypothetical protein
MYTVNIEYHRRKNKLPLKLTRHKDRRYMPKGQEVHASRTGGTHHKDRMYTPQGQEVESNPSDTRNI